MVSSPARASSKHRYQNAPWYCLLVVAVGLIFFFSGRQEEQTLISNAKSSSSSQANSDELQEGTVNDVPYYHCSASSGSSSSSSRKDLVLLHGAAFTKENWKSSGILQQFCARGNVAVTALDLKVRATSETLQKTLKALADEGLVQGLPVTGLVTPSASGKAVTQWIRQDHEQQKNAENTKGAAAPLSSFVRSWIPVAAGSVHDVPESALASLRGDEKLDVLAIYGDLDPIAGRGTSMKLQEHAGATVKELKGRHPCYLDSPDDFVEAVMQQLEKEK